MKELMWFVALWANGTNSIVGPFEDEATAEDNALSFLAEEASSGDPNHAFVYSVQGRTIPGPYVGDPNPAHDRKLPL